MKKLLGTLGLAAVLVLLPTLAAAQSAQVGQVSGEVTDASGGRLPGATVTLTSVERGTSRTAVTDGQGVYLFALVPLGRYDVSVTLNGFQSKKVTGNLVESDKTTAVPVSLAVASVEVSTTVTGETPIVDATNQTQQTRLRAEEFQKLALGRNYQTLIGQAPGVVGTGNVNAHGALTSNNQFYFDGVNTTDPTTGTFGANLNFEAIQEVVVRTSGISAEYGRATGAVVDVITKSGTNRFQGSYKFLGTNDNWNKQNSTKSEVAPNAALSRTKYDHVNPVNSFTGGGPIIPNRAWFFVAFENSKNTTAQRQTNAAPGFSPDNYQQTTSSPFFVMRLTTQLSQGQNLWFKYDRAPTTGFVIDYWGTAAENFALTAQDQGGDHYSAQYTAVLGPRWTAEATYAHIGNFINVVPFLKSPLSDGSFYWDENDGRFYNGATFDGYVRRPRNQILAATSYYLPQGSITHNLKFGLDWQDMKSENSFRYPNNTEFDVIGFNKDTRAYTPDAKLVYEGDPSASSGTQLALYARDKFTFGGRTNIEAGLRFEHQSGHSDVDALTVDTSYLEPRVSASFALTRDAKTLLIGTYGRFHDAVLQGFTDNFAAVPQQTNYDLFLWNGATYVFDSHFEQGAGTFKPDTAVTPRHMDEFTFGLDRQLSSVLGVGVRYVQRDWGNFVDDVRTFNPDNSIKRIVANVPDADRTYKGIEFTVDKRFSKGWNAFGSYTYGQTRGNHFGDDFTAVGDFYDATCRQTADSGLGTPVGTGFNFPCKDLQTNLEGKPTFDRPHAYKFGGAYTRTFKSVDVTPSLVGFIASKTTFTKQRSVNVLTPGTNSNSGQSLTYFYTPRGTDRVSGFTDQFDFALEAAYHGFQKTYVGVKFEIFNLFNNEEKTNVNNQAWCNATTTATCTTAVNTFGTATARASFLAPSTYRISFLIRR